MTNAKVYQGLRDDKKVEEHWFRPLHLFTSDTASQSTDKLSTTMDLAYVPEL